MRLRWIAALCCMAMLLAVPAPAANYPKKEEFFESEDRIDEMAQEYSFVAVTFETTYQPQLFDEFYAKYQAGQPAQLVIFSSGYASYREIYTINYAGGGTAVTVHMCLLDSCYDFQQPFGKMVCTDRELHLFSMADSDKPFLRFPKKGVVNSQSFYRTYPGHEKQVEAGRKAIYEMIKPLVEQYRSGVTPEGLPELPDYAVFPELESPDELNVSFSFSRKSTKADATVTLTYSEGKMMTFDFDCDESGNWTRIGGCTMSYV